MADKELVKKIEKSMEEGYRSREISKILAEQGHSQESIRKAFEQVNNMEQQSRGSQRSRPQQQQASKKVQRRDAGVGQDTEQGTQSGGQQQQTGGRQQHGNTEDAIKGVELTDSKYTIKQKLIRNRYRVYDPDGELVLKAKQKLFKLKENFPFKNPDGDVVFRVKSENIIDTAGDYVLEDERTGEPIAALDRKWTLFMHRWKIRDPEDERLLAEIEGDRKILEALRVIGGVIPYLNIFALLPHRYRIVDHNDNRLGEMQGKLSIRDIYELKLEDSGRAPREGLIAAAIAIDALEGN